MRSCLALFAVLVASAFLPAETAHPETSLQAEARQYSQQLLSVVSQIIPIYIRPVSREDLLLHALTGLYQAARMRVPANLRDRIQRASTASLDVPVGRIEGLMGGPPVPPAERELLDLIQRVREEVGRPEALEGQNPLLASCQAMARSLDPHSGIVTAEEQRRSIGLDAEVDGFGLVFDEPLGAGPLLIKGVQPGSPAQKAGVRIGDEITHLEGKPIKDMSLTALLALRNRQPSVDVPNLTGELSVQAAGPDRPVWVTLRRLQQGKPLTVELDRQHFRPETVLGFRRNGHNAWDYFVDPQHHLAHVRLSTLGKGTADELRDVLTSLEEEKLQGLILDLRWCPGGFLNEAVNTAGLFIGEGTIATVTARNKQDTVYRSTNEDKFRAFPVVVLINGETSGGAELIAAALQDHHRAILVGQRTLGKGSVQTPLNVGLSNVGLKLTTGTFIRPNGKNLHRFPDSKPSDDWGVRPDERYDFRISPELSRTLRQWWQEQTLRPGSSRERLPLDNPEADPQRQMALEVLRDLIKHPVQTSGK
jgi:carboxyl-terminal processing protease